MPCVLADVIFSSFLPFEPDFGQELLNKVYHPFVVQRTKGENWDGSDFKMGVGTACSEYSEWPLIDYKKGNANLFFYFQEALSKPGLHISHKDHTFANTLFKLSSHGLVSISLQ